MIRFEALVSAEFTLQSLFFGSSMTVLELFPCVWLLDRFNFVAISSNDIENYPQDSPDKMKELWHKLGLDFPYLYDESQEIAKLYKAECTPEFYLFNSSNKLVYRGRLDESSPGSESKPTGEDLRSAMENLLNNNKISKEQYPSMGCNIKWK